MMKDNKRFYKLGGQALCIFLGMGGLAGLVIAGASVAGVSAVGFLFSSHDFFFGFTYLVGIAMSTLGLLKLVEQLFRLGEYLRESSEAGS